MCLCAVLVILCDSNESQCEFLKKVGRWREEEKVKGDDRLRGEK